MLAFCLFLSCSSFHNSCALLTSGRSYCSSWGIIHHELCLSLGATPMQFPSESQTQLCPGSAVPCLIIKSFCPRCSSNPKEIKIENILSLLSPTSVYTNIGWGALWSSPLMDFCPQGMEDKFSKSQLHAHGYSHSLVLHSAKSWANTSDCWNMHGWEKSMGSAYIGIFHLIKERDSNTC